MCQRIGLRKFNNRWQEEAAGPPPLSRGRKSRRGPATAAETRRANTAEQPLASKRAFAAPRRGRARPRADSRSGRASLPRHASEEESRFQVSARMGLDLWAAGGSGPLACCLPRRRQLRCGDGSRLESRCEVQQCHCDNGTKMVKKCHRNGFETALRDAAPGRLGDGESLAVMLLCCLSPSRGSTYAGTWLFVNFQVVAVLLFSSASAASVQVVTLPLLLLHLLWC